MGQSDQSKNKSDFEKYSIPIITVAVVAMFSWLFYTVIEHGNRLTKLETKFDICVDCSQRTNKIGEYAYTTYKAVYTDDKGDVLLEADIDLLSEQFRWKCGSISEIVRGDEKADIEEVIKNYRDNAELKNAKGIVCIGTASAEGNTDGEESRANDRIETLINLVNSNLTTEKQMPIYGLNFGKYNEESNTNCSSATLDQRRIVLLKIIERSEKLTDDKLEESLRKILLDKATDPNIHFPIDIRKYSMFNSGDKMLVYGRMTK
jgi:hypothetical protein